MLVQHPTAAVMHFRCDLIPGQEAEVALLKNQTIALITNLIDGFTDIDLQMNQFIDLPIDSSSASISRIIASSRE